MIFETAIEKVIEKISFSELDYQTCISDVKYIVDALNAASKNKSTFFSNIFAELGSTVTFMKGNAIDSMPDFNYFLPFKMPLKMKPIFYYFNRKNLLRLKCKEKHALVEDGFVSAEYFHVLLSKHVKSVIEETKTIECAGRVYELTCHIRKMGNQIFAHNIKAVQVNADEQDPIIITFDFVPVFKFLMYETPLPNNVADNVEGARYWIICSAFIQDEISIFSKVTPYWQMLKPAQKDKARNTVRLIKAIAKKHNEEHFLEVCSSKSEIFWRVQELGEAYDNYTQPIFFLDIYARIINNIFTKFSPFLNLSKTFKFLKPFDDVLHLNEFLKSLQWNRDIDLNEVLPIFGLPIEI
ncbi:uncharacterized protein LOC6583185 [Drosophila mojavensis]|uniref:Mab-21-like nucleotidyltransferase domain-containing protein n=1 Tax=Drosophila mojavensis TaxID=7230 RepID=B4KUT1_DROMO|nr:uncharacterized protein LOC6583185 [Drosophila mojavensis]EDW19337.1 uncharacterized protein Dmoj_GI11578 [Drosophila mojavensis]